MPKLLKYLGIELRYYREKDPRLQQMRRRDTPPDPDTPAPRASKLGERTARVRWPTLPHLRWTKLPPVDAPTVASDVVSLAGSARDRSSPGSSLSSSSSSSTSTLPFHSTTVDDVSTAVDAALAAADKDEFDRRLGIGTALAVMERAGNGIVLPWQIDTLLTCFGTVTHPDDPSLKSILALMRSHCPDAPISDCLPPVLARFSDGDLPQALIDARQAFGGMGDVAKASGAGTLLAVDARLSADRGFVEDCDANLDLLGLVDAAPGPTRPDEHIRAALVNATATLDSRSADLDADVTARLRSRVSTVAGRFGMSTDVNPVAPLPPSTPRTA